LSGKRLSGRFAALTTEWNKQYFNQGAPKPGAKAPLATGTYNARTKRFSLTWRSKVSGGPFNGFTGVWHLKGRLRWRFLDSSEPERVLSSFPVENLGFRERRRTK
jgi:hypothetical protein